MNTKIVLLVILSVIVSTVLSTSSILYRDKDVGSKKSHVSIINHNGSPSQTQQQQQQNVGDVEFCLICVGLVDLAEKYIEKRANETEIIQELNHYCNVLKSQRDIQKCQSIVTNYAPKIIDLLLDGTKPELVCKEIDLC
eukprot:gene10144-12443_t